MSASQSDEFYLTPEIVVDKLERLSKKLKIQVDQVSAENAALTTQLEEVKGKLVMLEPAIKRFLDATEGGKVQGWFPDMLEFEDAGISLFKTLQALSPDIQRYREEIEREGYHKGVEDSAQKVRYLLKHQNLTRNDWRDDSEQKLTEYSQGFQAACELSEDAVLSLLPKQKEVSE